MLNETKKYDISHTELKKMKGFENVSEDESKEICSQLKELSFIFYEIYQSRQNRKI